VLGDVREGLRDDEVRGGLHRRCGPLGELDVDRRRHRGAGRERGHGGGQAPVGEDRGRDAAGERAQLGEGLGGLGARLGEQPRGGLGVVGQAALRGGQVHAQPHEALLRAVVDVALEAAQRRGLGGRGGLAAGGEVGHLRLERAPGRPGEQQRGEARVQVRAPAHGHLAHVSIVGAGHRPARSGSRVGPG
jgi:hypothetical protein